MNGVKPYPFISLFYTPDKETGELIQSICRDLKVYRSHTDYRLFGELVRERVESDTLSGGQLIHREGLNLMFSSRFSKESMPDRGSSLRVTPLVRELKLVVNERGSMVNATVGESDASELYENRRKYEAEFVCIEWTGRLHANLRLLMHLSFLLEWNRCRGIVICNYAGNPLGNLVRETQVFLKGVLHDFSHEGFVFHPFRAGSRYPRRLQGRG